ncbi:hypothetical protein ALT1644_220006 [Alteromonas macleodii]
MHFNYPENYSEDKRIAYSQTAPIIKLIRTGKSHVSKIE